MVSVRSRVWRTQWAVVIMYFRSLDTVQLAFVSHAVYTYTVTDFANPIAVLVLPWYTFVTSYSQRGCCYQLHRSVVVSLLNPESECFRMPTRPLTQAQIIVTVSFHDLTSRYQTVTSRTLQALSDVLVRWCVIHALRSEESPKFVTLVFSHIVFGNARPHTILQRSRSAQK